MCAAPQAGGGLACGLPPPAAPAPTPAPLAPPPRPAASVAFFHGSHFTLPPFAPALSREFAPYKPNPASLLHIAERWGVAPSELVMIGDSWKDDVSSDGWRRVGARRGPAVGAPLCAFSRKTALQPLSWVARRHPTSPHLTPPTRPFTPQIVCGNRAGALTILLDEHHRWEAVDSLHVCALVLVLVMGGGWVALPPALRGVLMPGCVWKADERCACVCIM